MHWTSAGSLAPAPALEHLDLLPRPVAAGIAALDPDLAPLVGVAEIDPDAADTAAFCDRYGSPLAQSANCVVIRGKRGDSIRYAACIVLATTRADVNGLVRRRLDARSASFAPMDEAVELTGMAYGGITPVGLPSDWPILIDTAVLAPSDVVVGAGVRGAKLFVPPAVLAALPAAEVVEGLAR